MIIGWGLWAEICAHGVNDFSSLDVLIEEEDLLLDGFLDHLDQYTHRSLGEVVIVT